MKRRAEAAVILWCAASLACRPQPNSARPEPGAELYAVSVNSIREVLLSSSTRKIYAYRWASDLPYQLVIASREGVTAEQCSGGLGFERLLQILASVPVVEESERRFEEGTAGWVDVLLRDNTNLEPIQARIRIPEVNGEPVVVKFGERQYKVRVDAWVLRTAKSGCAELGRGH